MSRASAEPELGEPARWRRIAEKEEAHVHLVAEALKALEPGRSDIAWRRRSLDAADPPDPSSFGSSEVDTLRWRAEFHRARGDYLERRLRVVKERTSARARWSENGRLRRGLDRFGLTDDVLEPARDSIKQAGGITAAHDAEMGRPRNHPPQGDE